MPRSPVLIVDDDTEVRDTVAEALADAGYATVKATDGADGLQKLAAMPERPSVILLDLMMPILDGIDFLKALGTSDRFREIPVVVLTASGRAVHGAREILRKPFRLEALLDVVRREAGAPT